MQTKSKRSRILSFVLLHAILLMYSFCSVFSKLAASAEFMSFRFVLYYGLMLLILAAYALLWQQVLKRMPLNTAFANKGVVIIWGMIWGALIFSEAIKWYMIVGALIIFCGIVLVVSDNE
ncbi:MAG: transporter [Acutalibacteraceae bacterium]